ncbi:hypothetical protein GE061_008653 [Apolygus lucorum]|uniref:RNase H type-1 domain-containing protein n=1 Tax=Apolygus lucorum TaxID=248454 RepID=A0A8S9WLF3_APOLU|nr:hypothetical protein GE061_008653 [Apolygus lucorum]
MKGFVEDMKMRIPSEEQLKLLVPKGGWSGMITSSIPGVKKNEGIPSELLQKTMLYLHYNHATKLYTDGTKSAEGAAGAVWCEEHRFTSGARLHVLSSSYQAEVEGLTLALKHVSAHDKNKRVVIITDSKAALDALANLGQDDLPPLYLLRLTQLLRNRVQEGYTLHFQWAPSHLGVPGNEKVDRYVRQVSTMEDVPVGLRTNHKDCEQEIRSRLRREWSVDYESGTGAGEWTRSIFTTPANTPWYKDNRTITNRQITEVNRLLSGHANNNVFKHRMNPLNNSPICNDCNENVSQTVEHTLTQCTKYRNIIVNVLDGETDILQFMRLGLTNTDRLLQLQSKLQECGAHI